MTETLKPCPRCKSSNVEENYTGTRTTFNGPREAPTDWHEYQSGWVECNDCGFSSESVEIDYQYQDFNLGEAVREKWNTRANQQEGQ